MLLSSSAARSPSTPPCPSSSSRRSDHDGLRSSSPSTPPSWAAGRRRRRRARRARARSSWRRSRPPPCPSRWSTPSCRWSGSAPEDTLQTRRLEGAGRHRPARAHRSDRPRPGRARRPRSRSARRARARQRQRRSRPILTVADRPGRPVLCRPSGLRQLTVAVDGSRTRSAPSGGVPPVPPVGAPLELVEVAEDVPFASDSRGRRAHRSRRTVDPPVRAWDVLHGHDVHEDARRPPGLRPRCVSWSVPRPQRRPAPRPRGHRGRTVRHSPVPVLVVSPEAAAHGGPGGLAGSSRF